MTPSETFSAMLRGQEPLLALAPMQDVTGPAFWRVIAPFGGADVYWTEYFRVHADSRPDSVCILPVGHYDGTDESWHQDHAGRRLDRGDRLVDLRDAARHRIDMLLRTDALILCDDGAADGDQGFPRRVGDEMQIDMMARHDRLPKTAPPAPPSIRGETTGRIAEDIGG